MPNLNKVRGRGTGFGYRGGFTRNSGVSGALAQRGSNGVPTVANYGLSRIHNSDSRIGNGGNNTTTTRMLPPNAIPRVGRNQQAENKVGMGVSITRDLKRLFYVHNLSMTR